jgi:amidophosphoribosyltransferase
VEKLIGADWLIYQDLDDLVRAVQHDDAAINQFDTSCFSGEYVTGDVTEEYLHQLESQRSDEAKQLFLGLEGDVGAVAAGEEDSEDSDAAMSTV